CDGRLGAPAAEAAGSHLLIEFGVELLPFLFGKAGASRQATSRSVQLLADLLFLNCRISFATRKRYTLLGVGRCNLGGDGRGRRIGGRGGSEQSDTWQHDKPTHGHLPFLLGA